MVPSKVLNRTLIRNLILVAILTGLIFAVKAHELFAPIGKDAGTYLYIGWQWSEGVLPYQDSAFATKPPGIFLTLTPIFAVFGHSILAVRFVEMVWSFVASLCLFCLARKMYSPLPAWGVAFLFAALSNLDNFAQGGTLTEVYMLLPLILGAVLVVSWIQFPSKKKLVLLGIVSSLALLYKQIAVFDLAAFTLMVTWVSWRKTRSVRSSIFTGVWITGGLLLPIVATLVYFWLNQALNDYLLGTVTYPLLQGEGRWTWATATRLAIGFFRAITGGLLPGAILASVSFLLLVLRRIPRTSLTLFPFLWLGFETMGVLSQGLGFGHYYLQMIPALCLCTAPAIESAFAGRVGDWRAMSSKDLIVAVLLLAVFWLGALQPQLHPNRFLQALVHGRQQTQEEQLAAYIKANSGPGDYIYRFFANGGPIYFLAQRRSPTRWIHRAHVEGQWVPSQTSLNDGIRAEFASNILSTPPLFIIGLGRITDPHIEQRLAAIDPALVPFLKDHYDRIEIEGAVVYRWRTVP